MHTFVFLLVSYFAIHLLFGEHHYRRNSHRPWHQRVYISIAGPFGVINCSCKEDDPTVCEGCHQRYVEIVLAEVEDASLSDAIRWPWLKEVA